MQAPDIASPISFAHASASRILLVTYGVSSATVSLLPSKYHSELTLNWSKVIEQKQIWRILTSQFISDTFFDSVCTCILVYNLLVLERRWGTRKFLSLLLSVWSLSLGLNFIAYKLQLFDDFVPNMDVVPNGLFGPIFALLVFYHKDIPSGNQKSYLGFLFTRKMFVYTLALQICKTRRSLLASAIGILSGLIYRWNIFKIQRWRLIPEFIPSSLDSFFSYILPREKKSPTFKRVLIGATPEIHDDILYEHLTRRNVARNHLSFAQLPQHQQQPETSNINEGVQTASEEKIKTLVDMGFKREAVVNALSSSNGDLQTATSILLSPSS